MLISRQGDLPVLSNISQIICNDGPNLLLHPILFALGDEVVAVLDQGGSPQGRAIPLRTTPVAIVSRAIGHELWLTEAATVRQEGSRGIADGLENGLGVDVVIDVRLEGLVPEEELINECPESQGGIARPSEEVVRVGLGRAGNDESTSGSGDLGSIGADIVENGLECDLVLCMQSENVLTMAIGTVPQHDCDCTKTLTSLDKLFQADVGQEAGARCCAEQGRGGQF